MKFILNEKEYALGLIESGSMGKSEKISIRIMIKYYRSLGLTKEQAIEDMLEFMRLNLSYFKQHEWETLVKNMANVVYDHEQDLVVVEAIYITKKEWEVIQSVESLTVQKVLYMLLVYKKVQNCISKQKNEWFNGSLGEVFKSARVGGKDATVQAQGRIIHSLKELGYIDLAKSLKSLNLKLNYLDLEIDPETDEIEMTLTNFSDPIFEFYKKLGYRVVRCEKCGKMIRLKKKERASRKYCPPCREIAYSERSLRSYHRLKELKNQEKMTSEG